MGKMIGKEIRAAVTETEMTLPEGKIEIAEAEIEDSIEGGLSPEIPPEVNLDQTADHGPDLPATTDLPAIIGHLPGITGDLLETPRSFAYCTNQEMIMTFTSAGQLKEWMEEDLVREQRQK